MLSLLALCLLPQAPDPEEVSPERLRATLEALCSQPRFCGTPEAVEGAEYVARSFQEAGWIVQTPVYQAWLPRQEHASLTLIHSEGDTQTLDLREHGYPEDPRSRKEALPPMHAFSHPGRVQGRVVYAGHGRANDFAALREQGIGLDGRVALIRYGGLYRGTQVANAAAAGCCAALLYTDRRDDGADQGKVLPNGPWRPEDGIQRGSVFLGDGDPLTPGVPALPEAHRLDPKEVSGLPSIPSLPLSMANARLLLGDGPLPEAPRGLDAVVRLEVEQTPGLFPVRDVIGRIPGSVHPEEWILVGAHRDAWGYGAVDNGGGTTVLVETARVLGAALRRGWRPERTLILCSWDGEEWGLVGSTEWVEEHRTELAAHALAYLNLDVVASGPALGAFATPALASVVRAAAAAEGDTVSSELGTPGGGSDHVPFLQIAGVEVAGFGYHGGNGAYHSAYDTPFLVERFLDPEFSRHAAAGRILVRLLNRLSSSSTRLDGIAGWIQGTREALTELELSAAARASLRRAVENLNEAASLAPVPHPERFLRFFLPSDPAEGLLLWRSSGYGSNWFPEVREATGQGRDPAAAVARVSRAIEAAARGMRATASRSRKEESD